MELQLPPQQHLNRCTSEALCSYSSGKIGARVTTYRKRGDMGAFIGVVVVVLIILFVVLCIISMLTNSINKSIQMLQGMDRCVACGRRLKAVNGVFALKCSK